jgi:cysteine-rich repeat protein/parallel beta-helix repeat protein
MSIRTSAFAPALVAAALAVTAATTAAADTIIAGGTVINQTWTTAGSPYIVQGDITVPAGASLTIEPGVEVRAASSDAQMSGDTSKVEFFIDGTLDVNGTAGNVVTFRGVSAASGSWYGILVRSGATRAKIEHATIQQAIVGVSSAAAGTTFSATAVFVDDPSSNGFAVTAGSPTLDAVHVFSAGSYGMALSGTSSPTVRNSIVRNGSTIGIYWTSSGNLTVQGCTLNANNSSGVQSASSTGPVTVSNSVITNNSSYGLFASSFGTISVSYSDIWRNSSGQYNGNVSGGSGLINSNPLFVSATDLRLTSNSPARFGTATMGDLGALPYDGAATPGLYGTLWVNTTLTAAASPHNVSGDLTVGPGITLVVEAGATLQFAPSDIMEASDSSKGELQVRGTLVADGTPTNHVTFTSTSASSGAWYGIDVFPGATMTVLDNVNIARAIVGVTWRTTTSGNTIANVFVDDPSSNGFAVTAGSPTLDAVEVFSAGSYGMALSGTSSPTVRNSIVRNGSTIGIYWTSSGNLTVQGCTLNANNSSGVQSASSTGPVTVSNSIITNNSSYGLFASSFGTISVSYSDIWRNSSGQYNGNVSGGGGLINSNPLFVSATDLRLTSNSPARFGTSTSADLGALPYDGVATPGLYGTLWVNTTLTASASPHSVSGDLTVGAGRTLTIEPGATLQFAPSDIMEASDSSKGELQVLGTLVADGTPTSPVTFTSTSAVSGAWYGIDVFPGATANVLDHVNVARAIVGVTWRTTTTNNTLRRIFVDDPSSNGFAVTTGSPTLEAVRVFSAGSYGMALSGSSSPTVRNSIVHNGSTIGIYWTSSGTLSIQNCTLNANNSSGVQSASSTGPVTVANSIITNNSSYGLFASSFGTISVSYSNIWTNSSGQYNGNVSGGSGIQNANPQFVSSTDLHLQGASVSIDAGTTGPTTDFDGVVRPQDGNGIAGAQWDMGAYEYVLTAMCGNGAVEPGEACDSGAANGMYGACNAGCTGLGARCGDGITNGPEQCDDMNGSNTDACLNTCRSATCGDGYLHAGTEACDDGNLINTDACVGACVAATCGDGYVRSGTEQCDDGNMNNADACSNVCMASTCGDGIVQAGEECDDDNAVNTDSCLNSCLAARCGDSVIRTGIETCDDGNTVATDACTGTCQTATCGDGITHGGVEECDDANASNTDACVMGCDAATCGDGYVRAGVEGCDDGNDVDGDACTNACVSSTCGDGVVQAGVETCDDGNDVETDACRNNCSMAMCGDNITQLGVEDCDDGNTLAGDGCSPTCETEAGPDGGTGPDAGTPGDGDGGGGCCSTSRGARETGALAALAMVLVLRRRRRALTRG